MKCPECGKGNLQRVYLSPFRRSNDQYQCDSCLLISNPAETETKMVKKKRLKGASRIQEILAVSEAIVNHKASLAKMHRDDAYHCIREWSGIPDVADNTIAQSLKAHDVKLNTGPKNVRGAAQSNYRYFAKILLDVVNNLEDALGAPVLNQSVLEELSAMAKQKPKREDTDANKQ
jgi:hypothetical protein